MTAEKTVTPQQETKAAVEPQTNCLGCGKQLRKIKRYYRDGKFYCTKRCWRTAVKKPPEEKS